jgi:predicted nucleic acid-binding protein
VLHEIAVKGDSELTVLAIRSADWLTIQLVGTIPPPVAACRLDRGESAVLAMAQGEPESEAVLDDLAARRVAAALGIRCIGSPGLVLLAKRVHLIAAARPVLEEFRNAGLHLDEVFLEQVLTRIGK